MPAQTAADWLAAIRQNNELRFQLVNAVRQLALAAGPSIAEEVKYGGILFAGNQGFCGVFSYANHVTLEFSQGAELPDPHGVLEGKGKGRRHIKLLSMADVEGKHIQEYIALAYAMAG